MLKFDPDCYTHSSEPLYTGRLNLNKGNYKLLNELVETKRLGYGGELYGPQQGYTSLRETGSAGARAFLRPVPKANDATYTYKNKDAIRLKNKKRKLWTAYTHTQDEISYARYVRCKNDLRRLTRNLRKDFERKIAANIKDNPKGFWRYAGSRLNCKTGVENLRTENGNLTTIDSEKAEVLKSFFSSICTTEEPLSMSSMAPAESVESCGGGDEPYN